MMRGYDGASAEKPAAPKRYQVVRSGESWRVVVNGCFTRPIPDRKAAVRLARKLKVTEDTLRADPRYRDKAINTYFGGSGKRLNQQVIGETFVRTLIHAAV